MSDNISEIVQDKRQLQWKTNRKSCVLSVGTITNDLEGYFCCFVTFQTLIPRKI